MPRLKLKPGDMVMVIRVSVGSIAWTKGIRIGTFGTVLHAMTPYERTFFDDQYDWLVEFPQCPRTAAAESWLMKISPPAEGIEDVTQEEMTV